MDIKHLIAFVKAFYGANNNTICILTAKTGLANNMRHEGSPPNKCPDGRYTTKQYTARNSIDQKRREFEEITF
jgi:hypothetical protein